MFEIVISNWGLWFNLAIPFIIGAWLVFFKKEEYAIKEFFLQIGVTFLVLLIAYFAFFSTTTNLLDYEQHNGSVTKIVWDEEWEEEVHYTEEVCTGTGNNRTCRTVSRTRIDHHPDDYTLYTSLGEAVDISEDEYQFAKRKYGHTEEDVWHSGQVSIGDGNRFTVVPNEIIPTSVRYGYTNYVTAAKSNVIYKRVTDNQIKHYEKKGALIHYPEQASNSFGPIHFDRVIWKSTPDALTEEKLQKQLEMMATNYGVTKQVNPMVYITSENRDFFYVLRHYWNMGKKNDAILVVGVDNNGSIKWSDCIAFSKNKMFEAECRNNLVGKNISSPEVMNVFENAIKEHYVRKPMKDFEYLKENITLDFKWQITIFVLNLIASFFAFRFMLRERLFDSVRTFDRF